MADTVLVVRAVIQSTNREILFIRRSQDDRNNPGLLEFPGGKVDPDETVEQALVREVTEEIGVAVEPIRPPVAGRSRLLTEGKYEGQLYLPLYVVCSPAHACIRLSVEHDLVAWLSYAQAVTLGEKDITVPTLDALHQLADWLV